MEIDTLLSFMALAEKLKCNTRHSYTSSGREESVAEHTFRLGIFAWLIKDEFPDLKMDRVMMMCLFHDLGEAITGDVPCFEKGTAEEAVEAAALNQIVAMLPPKHAAELKLVLDEIEAKQTPEAKLFQALDKMEAVIQHNEADISTWLPLEYDLQLTYGEAWAQEFPYTKKLHQAIQSITRKKIEQEGSKN